MPAKRTTDSEKQLAGTWRHDRARPAPTVAALRRWPSAPSRFTAGERDAWARLGKALMPGKAVSASDLVLAEYVARTMALADAAIGAKAPKFTTVASLVRLVADLLQRLGASPTGRGQVRPLPDKPEAKPHDPTEEFAQ